MQRLDDLLANRGERFCALLVAPGLLDRLQAEQHRGQLLPGLVVQLPRQSAPLELLRLDDPAQRVAGDTRGKVDGDRGAWSEGLGQAEVGIGEAWVGAIPVVGDDHADRPAGGDRAGRRGRCARRAVGPLPGRPRGRRGASRPARPGAARAPGRSSSLLARAARRRSHRRRCRRPPRSAASRRRRAARSSPGVRRSASRRRRAISSSRRASSISLASAVPTSFSASSCSDQDVAASYRRAFSIATAAWLASVPTSSSSSLGERP